MGSKSIAQEAEGRMGYWLRGHASERNNCFRKIQPVGQKYRDKTTLGSKTHSAAIVFVFKANTFRYIVAQPIRKQHWL